MSQNLDTLLAVAAELRAAGHTWDGVALKVRRKARTVRRWPARYPDRWETTYRAAQLRRFDEIHNEASAHLLGLLRDPDAAVRKAAAEMVRRLGAAAATPEVLAALLGMLRDPHLEVRGDAASVLAEFFLQGLRLFGWVSNASTLGEFFSQGLRLLGYDPQLRIRRVEDLAQEQGP